MNRMLLIVGLVIIGATLPSALFGADVTLSWTATGDDGYIGTAAEYEIRYSPHRINASSWEYATAVANVPAPLPAGTQQTFLVRNMPPERKLYFAIRVRDDAGNWSPLSNNALWSAGCDCVALRGNVDGDLEDHVNIADLSEMLSYVFMGQSAVPCPSEANVNGDPYGRVDVSDFNLLVGFLFKDASTYRLAPCP